ncbi:hypothetical protein chiPu_0003383 [Chiloscyllium punctatum]|uniref:SHSP domain-containing protein n=1 Tax=Chiloscyllium punctatum TaxID=137246 RepID=A0A401S3K8_CHIPU|nr:hypothetical protein [Chiloscyllium punctatum]
MQTGVNPPEFCCTVNLSGVPPEELAVKIKDGRMCVYGEHVERSQDATGAMNLSLRGFSNEINLPAGLCTDSLTFTVCNNQVLKIQSKKPSLFAGSSNKCPPPQPAQCCPQSPPDELPKLTRYHGPRCPHRKQKLGEEPCATKASGSECCFATTCME